MKSSAVRIDPKIDIQTSIDLLNGLLVNTGVAQSEALRLNNAMRLTIKEFIRTHLGQSDPDVDVL
jgi:hypothetical protein